jgi:hypothetical protein
MEEKIELIKKHLTEISEELFKKYGTDSYSIRWAIADVKYSISKLHQPTVIKNEVAVCDNEWHESNMQHFGECHACGLKAEY